MRVSIAVFSEKIWKEPLTWVWVESVKWKKHDAKLDEFTPKFLLHVCDKEEKN